MVALAVEQQPTKKAWISVVDALLVMGRLLCQVSLNLVPEVHRNNRIVFPRMGGALVNGFADVEAVFEDVIQRSPLKGLAAVGIVRLNRLERGRKVS